MASRDEYNLHKVIGICACCIEAELLLFIVIYQPLANVPVITESVFLHSCVLVTLQQLHWYL